VFAILIILATIGISLHTTVKILHRRIVFWRKPDHKIET
jgi:ABC-type nitrate/sulfonate/bicarbonate transport system permease component